MDVLNRATTSPLIELRMAATEHWRLARSAELAGDEAIAERERLLAEECEAKIEAGPMLDPTWTNRTGYAHAHDLFAIAERAEARRKEMN